LLLLIAFQNRVEKLQNKLLLLFRQSFDFLKLSFKLRNRTRFLFLRQRFAVADELRNRNAQNFGAGLDGFKRGVLSKQDNSE